MSFEIMGNGANMQFFQNVARFGGGTTNFSITSMAVSFPLTGGANQFGDSFSNQGFNNLGGGAPFPAANFVNNLFGGNQQAEFQNQQNNMFMAMMNMMMMFIGMLMAMMGMGGMGQNGFPGGGNPLNLFNNSGGGPGGSFFPNGSQGGPGGSGTFNGSGGAQNPNVSPLGPAAPGSNRAQYEQAARDAARRYGIPEEIFVKQIQAESNFNPNAVSHAGARGIAQIMPATARAWGVNPNDPMAALDAAAKNMSKYYQTYGSWEKALAAYNAGPGNVNRWQQIAETRNYVQKILYS